MNFSLKKIIIFLIIFSVLFNTSGILGPNFFNPKLKHVSFKSVSFEFAPPKAEALTWSTFAEQLVGLARQVWEFVKENWQKWLRDIIAKKIIDYIVDETIKWVQGGGKPMFISDWNQFAKNAFNMAAGSVIEQTVPFLCSPFRLQVQLSLQPVPYFQQVSCTLDQVVSNINDFYDNFQNGGWIAYNTAWQPQNNYYGATLITYDQMITQGAAAAQAAVNEGLAGSGFLGSKQCKGGGKSSADLADLEAGGTNISNYQKDSKGNYCTTDQMQNVTPGATVGAAVASAITSDKDWAANIQSWISALINAVINRLTREGVGLMKGSSESNDYYYPPEYANLADQESNNNKQTMITEINKFANGWDSLLYYKNNSLSYVSSTEAILIQMQVMTCTPQVTNDEITSVQSDFDKLIVEVTDLNIKLADADGAIEIIQNADFSSGQQSTEAQAAYGDFMDIYNNNETLDKINPDVIDAASSESQAQANNLAEVQSRLNVCQAGTATSTYP